MLCTACIDLCSVGLGVQRLYQLVQCGIRCAVWDHVCSACINLCSVGSCVQRLYQLVQCGSRCAVWDQVCSMGCGAPKAEIMGLACAGPSRIMPLCVFAVWD